VVRANLERSGLFSLIPREAFLKADVPFDTVPSYQDWRVINAEALLLGRVAPSGAGRLAVQFRLFDVVGGEQIVGQQLVGPPEARRRLAHKLSDVVFAELTGEGPYFDSQIAFIDETGPKGDRLKRLAVMDQDGENLRYPGPEGLVLTPRFSPDGERVLYISYDTGQPEIFILDLATGQRRRLGNVPGMTFAPRFSPSGETVVLSVTEGGNTDLYTMRLASRRMTRLTRNPGIDTSASFSPDGTRIVFESDRGGSQQLYVMPVGGGAAERISFGQGRYGTPVWSPKGDLIAFTKITGGRFHIGVMRPDGSGERLLTTSFLDEGPSFSPNGRFLTFYRDEPGERAEAKVMSVDVTGRTLRVVPTPNAASDPSWSPLRE
jgi:TolB protein